MLFLFRYFVFLFVRFVLSRFSLGFRDWFWQGSRGFVDGLFWSGGVDYDVCFDQFLSSDLHTKGSSRDLGFCFFILHAVNIARVN